MNARRHLVLGGARSGKTAFALQAAAALAQQAAAPICYLATAEALDEEMTERIARHRQERPAAWRTIEAPVHLAARIGEVAIETVIIVDCLTVWLSNVMLKDFDAANPRAPLRTWARERERLLECLAACPQPIVLVSNEVGNGIVPLSALARRFQDEQGWLNQAVARVCDAVTFVAAGLPLTLKPPMR